jgi:DNA-nicking Smr family endonuclease
MGRRRASHPQPSGPRGSLHVAVVEDELDLHQLVAAEAAVALELFLERTSRSRPGAVVRVITGRGTRSAHGPVLAPLVRSLLRGDLARFVEDFGAEAGGGAWRVRLRGGQRPPTGA